MSKELPLVTVGIPSYNRPALLDKVIRCSISQTYENLEILISDNASNLIEIDDVIEKYSFDKRIKFFRQKENIGMDKNFEFLVKKAKGDFFTLSADDDYKSEDFIEKNLDFLLRNPDYVGSTSKTRFEDSEYDAIVMGDKSIDDHDPYDRINNFLNRWHANSRFFSVVRSKEFKESIAANEFLGGDWLIIVRLLILGKFKRIDNGEVILGKNGLSHNDIFRKYRKSFLYWLLPFFKLTFKTAEIFREATLKQKMYLSRNLFRLNYQAFIWQIKREVYLLKEKSKYLNFKK